LRIIILGSYIDDSQCNSIERTHKEVPSYSGNIYQRNLLEGFEEIGSDVQYFSFPAFGSYPNSSKLLYIKRILTNKRNITYLPYINIFGIRLISRFLKLRSELKRYIKQIPETEPVAIVIWGIHTPFLLNALLLKKDTSHTILVFQYVLDLPEYMSFGRNRTKFYQLLKKIDKSIIDRCFQSVDYFILLTAKMKEKLEIKEGNFFVFNGLLSQKQIDSVKTIKSDSYDKKQLKTYRIVYTGAISEVYGVPDLVKAFLLANIPDSELIICGTGDAVGLVQDYSRSDIRVKYLGALSPDDAVKVQVSADLLVNPRQNKGEYTKYSFPSKIFEYLLIGVPILCYKLDGIPDEFDSILTYIEGDSIESFAKALIQSRNFIKTQDNKNLEVIINKNLNIAIARTIIGISVEQVKK